MTESLIHKILIGKNLHGFTESETYKIVTKITTLSRVVINPINPQIEDIMCVYRKLWDKNPKHFKNLFGFTPEFAK